MNPNLGLLILFGLLVPIFIFLFTSIILWAKHRNRLYAKILTGSGEWIRKDITDLEKYFDYNSGTYLIERAKVATEGFWIVQKKILSYVEGCSQPVWHPSQGDKTKELQRLTKAVKEGKDVTDMGKDEKTGTETTNPITGALLIDAFEFHDALRGIVGNELLATGDDTGFSISKKWLIVIAIIIGIGLVLMFDPIGIFEGIEQGATPR
jgi:uncharacterized membrane protein YbaN (DUF454 family)